MRTEPANLKVFLDKCGVESFPSEEGDHVRRLICPQCGIAGAELAEALDDSGDLCLTCLRCKPSGVTRYSPDEFCRVFGHGTDALANTATTSALSASYARSDAGNAEVLCELFSDRLAHRHGPEDWLVWDGRRWRVDDSGEAQKLALQAARWRFAQAAAIADTRQREKEAGWAISSECARRIRDCLTSAAESIEGFGRQPGDFDNYPLLLCCPNVIADLETGELLAHDPALMLTKLAGAPYRLGERGERWERFLREVFDADEELVGFIQRLAGYSATGCVHEHVLPFCHGGGANGKSVLLNTLRAALGEYARHGDFATFTVERAKRGGPREDLARLLGVRMLTAAEASGGAQFDEATVKATTGSDPIVARHLYGHPFQFLPTHTTWLAANTKPRVRDTSFGFWRRLLLIPFQQDFSGRADQHLEEKLRAELPAVLAWIVEGAVLWHRQGLSPPRKVQAATAAYRAREDVVAAFVSEWTLRDPEAEVGATDLYKAYTAHCEQAGERALTQRYFSEELERHGLRSERRTSGPEKGRKVYRGLALGQSEE
jgi:putative DNA primase/helicase